jgi:hypothetical protein
MKPGEPSLGGDAATRSTCRRAVSLDEYRLQRLSSGGALETCSRRLVVVSRFSPGDASSGSWFYASWTRRKLPPVRESGERNGVRGSIRGVRPWQNGSRLGPKGGPMKRIVRSLPILVAGGLLLGACSASGANSPTSTTTRAKSSLTTAPQAKGTSTTAPPVTASPAKSSATTPQSTTAPHATMSPAPTPQANGTAGSAQPATAPPASAPPATAPPATSPPATAPPITTPPTTAPPTTTTSPGGGGGGVGF